MEYTLCTMGSQCTRRKLHDGASTADVENEQPADEAALLVFLQPLAAFLVSDLI